MTCCVWCGPSSALPVEDEDKILRMVDLLTLRAVPVQHRTQRMLRGVAGGVPDTKRECVAGVDDVLAYLESNVASTKQTALRGNAARDRGRQQRAAVLSAATCPLR